MIKTRELALKHPIRLLNYRYPLYIVPRLDFNFAIGATQFESDSLGEVTVQSALELLHSASTLHPSLRYAEITELKAQLRPTLPSHLPNVEKLEKLTRINGLYRYGFLLAPYLVEQAIPWN